MTDDVLARETIIVSIDRSIFGLDEDRGAEEQDRPYWVDLPMDSEPVRVGLGIVRVMSKVGSHEAPVTIEVRRGPHTGAAPDYELLGEWPYLTASGKVGLYNIDGPLFEFELEPARQYTLRVWRKGGETASQKYDELMGNVYPIEGLEEYIIQFWTD
ncbi:Haze protective factor 1 [Streptomyces sp. 4.24]|uniref:Haze protective factor 1 n=1 Tax=Streptomyces tritrimontium TaxID=3406573 RepID=UPI003BB525E6